MRRMRTRAGGLCRNAGANAGAVWKRRARDLCRRGRKRSPLAGQRAARSPALIRARRGRARRGESRAACNAAAALPPAWPRMTCFSARPYWAPRRPRVGGCGCPPAVLPACRPGSGGPVLAARFLEKKSGKLTGRGRKVEILLVFLLIFSQ